MGLKLSFKPSLFGVKAEGIKTSQGHSSNFTAKLFRSSEQSL